MADTTPLDAKDPKEEMRERIGAAFERLRENRWSVAQTTADERIAKLKRLKQVILSRREDLKQAMWQDFHKPASEVELTEIQPTLVEINHTISHLKQWMKPVPHKAPPTLIGTKSVVRHEPKGVCLILAPWNYPFFLFASPLVAAISAGNVCMMRPSDKVKATSKVIDAIIREAFPANEVAVFTGPSYIANIMLELPFDHIFFTGSPNVGRQVMAAAAKHLASCTLELGGKSPVIVDETADVEKAAERIVWGKYLNGGQTCVAPDHIYVHESRHDAFVAAARRVIEARYGTSSEARKRSDDFCRIVDANSQKKLKVMIDDSVSKGARLEIGGEADNSERYLEPTVLSNVTEDSPAMEFEIFGPVLPILKYRGLDEVFRAIHSRGKPLALYVFSESTYNQERILKNTTAGGTVINNVLLHVANPELPFGGVGESGLGNYHGIYGFKCFSHERAVVTQGRVSALEFFYPPYTPKVKKMLDGFTKLLEIT
ncbi:MAG: aldehyde dehydrogenase family protein [Polyangiales bacterium]